MSFSRLLRSRMYARLASAVALRIDGGKVTPKVTTLSALKPGSIFHNALRLRISSPAPINNTSAIAISAMTKPPCARARVVLAPRPLSFNASLKRHCEVFSAGARPETIPVSSEMPIVKSRTRTSSVISSARGNAVGNALIAAVVPQAAMNSPAAPPTSASIVLSISD